MAALAQVTGVTPGQPKNYNDADGWLTERWEAFMRDEL